LCYIKPAALWPSVLPAMARSVDGGGEAVVQTGAVQSEPSARNRRRKLKRAPPALLFGPPPCVCGHAAGVALPGQPRHSSANKPAYPMHVLSVQALLKLPRLLPHQTLKNQGLLQEWAQDMRGRVIFVSHEWLGFGHPDPAGEQFAALKRILQRLMDGSIPKVESHWVEQVGMKHTETVTAAAWKAALPHMFVWFDYWSVPQPGAPQLDEEEDEEEDQEEGELAMTKTLSSDSADHRFAESSSEEHAHLVGDLQKAVASIPEYVECSDLLLVLVPVCKHHDRDVVCNYSTWRSRGWCRVELQAALLKHGNIHVMVCNGAETTPFFIYPSDAWQLVAGEGEYTCCRLGHKINGEVVECDKLRIRGVLSNMLDSKVQHLESIGNLASMRWLCCMRHYVLRGLPLPEQVHRPEPLMAPAPSAGEHCCNTISNATASLRRRLSWTAADDAVAASTGRSLWLYAALADDVPAMQCLLQGRSRVGLESEVLQADLSFGELPMTPLMAAMAVARFEVVELLLRAGAKPHQRVAKTTAYQGVDALMFAAMFGRADNVKAWLARFPTWDLDRRDATAGCDVLMTAALFGPGSSSTLATVRVLLEAKASPLAENDLGDNALTVACDSDRSGPEVVRELLAAGASVNHQQHFHTRKCKTLLLAACRATRLRSRSLLLQTTSQLEGCTPLFRAARWGKVEEIRELLAARADTNLRNHKGQTALEVARESDGAVLASELEQILSG